MTLYMTRFSYTTEAWKALVKRPEDGAAVLAEHAQRLGGRMVSFYYSMGEFDGVVVYEAPMRGLRRSQSSPSPPPDTSSRPRPRP